MERCCILLALVFVQGCGSGPLGLAGEYLGTRTEELSGTVTTFGATTTNADVDGTDSTTTIASVESGAGGTSASFFSIEGCVVLLAVDGDEVTLDGDAGCERERELTVTTNAVDAATAETTTVKIKSFTLTSSGDDGIKVDAEGSVETTEEANGDKTRESKIDFAYSFEGELVAPE